MLNIEFASNKLRDLLNPTPPPLLYYNAYVYKVY